MEKTTKRLERNLVADTSQWRLLLRVGRDNLDVMAYTPHQDNSLIFKSLPIDANTVNALEEVVYDNPFLLRDFSKITILLESEERLIIPSDASMEEIDELMYKVFPELTGEVITDTIPRGIVSYGADRRTVNFLRRTFFNCSFLNRMTPLCRYFLGSSCRSNSPRIYAVVNAGAMDVIATQRGELKLANTFRFTQVDDAAYYILAVKHTLFPEIENVEIMLAGPGDSRTALQQRLSEMTSPVIPAIFPSDMFRAGNAVLQAPFEMVIIPPCE